MPISDNLFKLKRAQEKTLMLIKRDPSSKVSYYHILLDKRLKEIIFLIIDRRFNKLVFPSQRYATTAGELTEIIISNNLSEMATPTRKIFTKHQNKIQEILDSYPREINDEWKFIQDDFNYLEIYKNQLSEAFKAK